MILQTAVKNLATRYPIDGKKKGNINNANDKNDNDQNGYGCVDASQIEGLNVQVTADNGANVIVDYEEKRDDSDKYDSKYICPITKKLMNAPVIAYDGCVYEKEQ